MINFPYILGNTGQTFTFSDDGYFRYPKQVTIPANVKTLSGNTAAFRQHIEIENIDFETGSQLLTIGTDAFSGCTGLKSIVFPANRPLTLNARAFSGDDALEIVAFPDCIVNIGNAAYAFAECKKLSQSSFEALMEQATGTAIQAQTFYNCQEITSLIVPDTVTQIMSYAFSGCTSLLSVNLNNVTTLQVGAFINCTSLPEVNLKKVTSLQGAIFAGNTTLKKVTFERTPTTASYIAASNNNNMFYGCTALEDVVLPDGWNINMLLSDGTAYFTNVLTHDSMVAMIANLYDYSGGTAHTLTLGATNLARLSAEEIAVATAKNWTLA